MPSIFARARTTSSKKLPRPPPAHPVDEFGRVSSRASAKSPKDRTKQRNQNSSEYSASAENDLLDTVEDGFLPTCVGSADTPQQTFGYLSHGRQIVLGIDDVTRLVDVVSEELGARGLTTPFLFSNTAIDISPPAIRRLISSFLNNSNFNEECQFAGPHDLGMLLRWGLARVVRIVNGQEMRGLVGWDVYLAWRGGEQASNYARTEFTRFLPLVPAPARSLLLTLFTLLTRLVANSTSSGLTPLTLSSLFGPLLFGLGHLSMAFHHAYAAYLRSAHATEHLLLAFIRLQDAQATGSTPIPSRLKSWITGYPAMLAPNERLDKPRRGVRTLRVTSVRRNVRLYSPDLVRSCAAWARDLSATGTLRASKEWQRIAPASAAAHRLPPLPPRYSDAYRKRMDLPASFIPDMGHGSPPSLSTTSSTTSTVSTRSTLSDDREFGLGAREGENRFRSLTDLKWGAFEELGFGEGDKNKLQFDLNESARSARNAKRATLTWADFSDAGFMRNDPSLNTTLQFSAPVTHTITEWPNQAAEIQRKLKKAAKDLPAFGWDTAPIMGGEEVIEENFIDVFCDLIYGGGWTDRDEGTFRDCNWALVEFKSLPTSHPTSVSAEAPSNDPRTATSVLLFEEFVPLEYRSQLTSPASTPIRKRLPSLFSPSKAKAWKPAATLNGRPYVVGSVPRSPSAQEVEFEGLLRGGGGVTKVITLDQASKSQSQLKVQTPVKAGAAGAPISSPLFVAPPPASASPTKGSMDATAAAAASEPSPVTTPSGKRSRFRFPGGLPVGGPAANRNAVMIPAEYDSVDFETRLASYSDEETNGSGKKEEKRAEKDEAWVDILVASQGARLDGQDAELRPPRNVRGLKGGRSDPELASQEVAQALAAVRQHPPTDDEADGDTGDVDGAPHPSPPPGPSTSTSQQRPLGYFDLHPERKPKTPEPYARVPEPDDAFAFDDVDDGDDDDARRVSVDTSADLYGEPEPASASAAAAAAARDSVYSDGDFEPAAGDSEYAPDEDGDIEVPAFVDDDEHVRRARERGHVKVESTTLPPSLGVSLPAEAQSKTAALIEMYREREKGAGASAGASVGAGAGAKIASPTPSRLPVRSALATNKEQPPLPTVAPSPARSDSLPLDPLPAPPPLVPAAAADVGRNSPLRYVHGAPLHNVLEEGDEEDDDE